MADRSQAYGTTASAMFAYLSQKGFCMEARLPSVGEGDEVKKYISNQLHRMVDKTRIDYNTDEPCPRIRNHPLNGVLSLSQKLNEAAMDTVAATANRACEPRKIGAPLKIKVSTHNYLGAKDDPTDAIAGLLDRGVPAGISLDIGFMYKGAAKVDHAASVVASHWNGETCEFKIRNTTADCSIYNEKYRGRCNGGHVWVSAEDLRYRVKNVFGALR